MPLESLVGAQERIVTLSSPTEQPVEYVAAVYFGTLTARTAHRVE